MIRSVITLALMLFSLSSFAEPISLEEASKLYNANIAQMSKLPPVGFQFDAYTVSDHVFESEGITCQAEEREIHTVVKIENGEIHIYEQNVSAKYVTGSNPQHENFCQTSIAAISGNLRYIFSQDIASSTPQAFTTEELKAMGTKVDKRNDGTYYVEVIHPDGYQNKTVVNPKGNIISSHPYSFNTNSEGKTDYLEDFTNFRQVDINSVDGLKEYAQINGIVIPGLK